MDVFKLFLYPFSDLTELGSSRTIENGSLVSLSRFCSRRCKTDENCSAHYNQLKASPQLGWHPCPYGYSSYTFSLANQKLAITGLVPFPRMQIEKERNRAKDSPEQKVARQSVENNVRVCKQMLDHVSASVSAEVTRNLAALHEVRKYNRTVRQNLERMCIDQSKYDPDAADPNLVRVWKLSELMSAQFDILSLIADGNLASLAPNTNSEVYRIFDKCAKIYRIIARDKSMKLILKGDSPRAMVSDKTFPIIPTVLMDNAIKYGSSGGSIDVEIKIIGISRFRVSVANDVPKDKMTPRDPFQKGVRGDDQTEGSGIGLYLAQQVAHQHGSKIEFERIRTELKDDRIEFRMEMTSV